MKHVSLNDIIAQYALGPIKPLIDAKLNAHLARWLADCAGTILESVESELAAARAAYRESGHAERIAAAQTERAAAHRAYELANATGGDYDVSSRLILATRALGEIEQDNALQNRITELSDKRNVIARFIADLDRVTPPPDSELTAALKALPIWTRRG